MKLKLYMDLYPGWQPQNAYANANPAWEICAGQKRLSFVVDIPDYLIEPEVTLRVQETSFAEEVK
jgi:hypothetical protein